MTVPGPVPPVTAAGRYRGPLRAALLAYKEQGRRDLAAALAGLLEPALAAALAPGPMTPVVLVPAPSRRAAARARGGDHVRRWCRGLAAAVPGTSVVPLLGLVSGVRDSVGLDAVTRAANLAGAVTVRRAVAPRACARTVLVDDVVTTGATLVAATRALVAAGVPVCAAVVLCDATGGPAGTGPSPCRGHSPNGTVVEL